MTAGAHVEQDWMRGGVKLAIWTDRGEHTTSIIRWGEVSAAEIPVAESAPEDAFLHLTDDIARALYEALSVHFGGNVVDATRLRKDYDAERARVDLFIKHTIGRS
jgi:hypothetical protein